MRRATFLTILVVLAASLAAAQEPVGGWRGVDDPERHVRGLRNSMYDAEALILEASRRSATVRRLLDALQHTDVLVWVELRPDLPLATACLRPIGTSAAFRRLHVGINPFNAPFDQIKFLGHELWHAWEIAQAPGVETPHDVARLFLRIGWRLTPGGHDFETAGAIDAGNRVYQEVWSDGQLR